MNLTITRPGGHFELTDHHGSRVTPETYRGRFMLVFFGFTHCQEICPAALSRNSRALELLGADADRVQPLYISVDPARDTPEVMRAYLRTAHPRYTGLTGSIPEVEAAKAAYRVFSRPIEELDGYAVPHTSFTFLMDPAGDYLTHYSDTLTPAELTDRLRPRLSSASGGPDPAEQPLVHAVIGGTGSDCCH